MKRVGVYEFNERNYVLVDDLIRLLTEFVVAMEKSKKVKVKKN